MRPVALVSAAFLGASALFAGAAFPVSAQERSDPRDLSGRYRLTFDTGTYFRDRGEPAFYPEVAVVFTVAADEHHHVPLLLSPFGYSTYRGS